MTYTGTSNFTSIQAAQIYYGIGVSVSRKIEEGAISIGPPAIKPGQTLSVNREGRYVITDKN
jgi:hypothetical protein